MIFIFDNIVASIIVATLFFALAATQLRVQETGIAQVSSHAAKTKALTLGQWLDEDIIALGEDVPDNSARFDNPTTGTFDILRLSEEGEPEEQTVTYTTEWRFYSDMTISGVQHRRATRYWLTQVSTIEVEVGDEEYDHPLFQLRRATSEWKSLPATFTASDFTEDGRSASTLSYFHIQFLDYQGNLLAPSDPTAPTYASFIGVDFSMVPEFELRRGYLRELYWSTTLKVRPFWG